MLLCESDLVIAGGPEKSRCGEQALPGDCGGEAATTPRGDMAEACEVKEGTVTKETPVVKVEARRCLMGPGSLMAAFRGD